MRPSPQTIQFFSASWRLTCRPTKDPRAPQCQCAPCVAGFWVGWKRSFGGTPNATVQLFGCKRQKWVSTKFSHFRLRSKKHTNPMVFRQEQKSPIYFVWQIQDPYTRSKSCGPGFNDVSWCFICPKNQLGPHPQKKKKWLCFSQVFCRSPNSKPPVTWDPMITWRSK